MCTNFQTKRTTLNFWAQICPKMNFGSEFQKSKSGFGIITSNIPCVSIFSQNGQLLIFRPKFGKIAQLRAIFWFKYCWGCCRELGRGRWSWVEVGARFSNTRFFSECMFIIVKKPIIIVKEPSPVDLLKHSQILILLITLIISFTWCQWKMHPIFKRMIKFASFSLSHFLIEDVNVPLVIILNSSTIAILDQLPQGLANRLDTILTNRWFQYHSLIQMNKEKKKQELEFSTIFA